MDSDNESKRMKTSLTAIVPVYNEEKFVNKSLEKLASISSVDDILLVDDCSTDKSLEILNAFSDKHKNVRVYSTEQNGGKGSAIKSVFKYIKTDYAIIHDADLEYDPSDIEKMLLYVDLHNKNFVLGSRFLMNSKIQLYRRTYFANKFLSLVFSVFHSKRISDIASCYKLMPATYLRKTTFIENGFAIEVELLAKFLKENKNLIEVPISYKARSYEDGKKIKTKDGFKYIYSILKYRLS